MALLGRNNRLVLNRFVEFGAYVDGGDLGEILLPKRSIPPDAKAGDIIEAFIYRDSEDRLIATTRVPYAEVGDCAFLEVVAVNAVGAFLDWGLEKDLFAPFAEQRRKMKVGQRHVVYLYIDNSDRIAASSKLRKFLPTTTDEYEVGEEVDLIVSAHTELGYEAAIDDLYLGMVFENDALSQLEVGMRTTGYIKNIRADGKINLCLQPPLQTRGDLGDQILDSLRARGGSSSITDKSTPDEIFAEYAVSKRAYKQALGALYKARQIVIEPGKISLVED